MIWLVARSYRDDVIGSHQPLLLLGRSQPASSTTPRTRLHNILFEAAMFDLTAQIALVQAA